MRADMIYCGNSAETIASWPDECVDCCVTSPPYYGLRDYGAVGQIGLEETPEAYIARLVEVFRQVRRVLKPNGTLWVNIGNSYAGSNKKMSPWGPKGRIPFAHRSTIMNNATTVREY